MKPNPTLPDSIGPEYLAGAKISDLARKYHSGPQTVLDKLDALNVPRRIRGRPSASHIDLGLALLSVLRKPHETLSYHDISAWCNCSPQRIQQIGERGLRKLRVKLKDHFNEGNE